MQDEPNDNCATFSAPFHGLQVITMQSQLCASCKKPAVIACPNCKDSPIPDNTTEYPGYYCSRVCQYAHKLKHKTTCKRMLQRRLLYRAGDLLQALFYTYRENVFDKQISKIEDKDGKLYLHGIKSLKTVGTKLDMLQTFPRHLVTNEADKQHALAYLACCDASWMNDFVGYMLKGMCM